MPNDQRPEIRFDDETGRLEIRASALSNCRRRLWYVLDGQQMWQGKEPNEASEFVMRMGELLEEPVAAQWGKEHGFQVHYPSRRLNVIETTVWEGDGIKVVATGTPDRIASKDNREHLVEIKTRNGAAYERWSRNTALISHPGAAYQMALYTLMLIDAGIDVAEPGYLVVANRETGEIAHEEFTEQDVLAITEDIDRIVSRIMDDMVSDDAPERPFRRSSVYCRNCPFEITCWGDETDDDETDGLMHVTEEQAIEAIRVRNQYDESVKDLEKDFDQSFAKKVLLRWAQQEGGKTSLEVDDQQYNLSVVSPNRQVLDEAKLKGMLSKVQQKEVWSSKASTPYVKVTKARRKAA